MERMERNTTRPYRYGGNWMYDVLKMDTDIFGLKWRTTFSEDSEYDDDMDCIHLPPEEEASGVHFTECNVKVLKDTYNLCSDVKTILEIGILKPVNENDMSTTKVLHSLKSNDVLYLGVDKRSTTMKSENHRMNIYCVQTCSSNKEIVLRRMKELGSETIDVLIIDGWHSVKMTVNDWEYVNHLSPGGMVVIHDTNWHPGPITVFDAIDETMFKKKKYCKGKADWGIGVAHAKF